MVLSVDLLKAAGTPMMRPLPFITFARLTLSPGLLSTKSTEGIESPTLTILALVAWKL